MNWQKKIYFPGVSCIHGKPGKLGILISIQLADNLQRQPETYAAGSPGND